MKALFVIDMQEEYVGKDNKYGYNSNELISRVNERIIQAQENSNVIIYIKNRKNLKSGVVIPEFATDLKVVSDYIFYKDKSSVFSIHEIQSLLKQNDVTEIETIGVDGCCCVASSAIEGARLGYKVTFPCHYIGVNNPDRYGRKKPKLIKEGINIIE